PGYGFLAENPHFVEVCESCNIKFIGPSSRAMRSMGDKNAARAAARKAGVPVTPGSDGIVETEDEAMRIAKKLGYPVMVKAAGGDDAESSKENGQCCRQIGKVSWIRERGNDRVPCR